MSRCPQCAVVTFTELKIRGKYGIVLYDHIGKLKKRADKECLDSCLCGIVWWSLRFDHSRITHESYEAVKLFLNPPLSTPKYLDIVVAKSERFAEMLWAQDFNDIYRLGPPDWKPYILRARLRLYQSTKAGPTARVLTRVLARTSGSPECIELAEEWLRNCGTNHTEGDCRPAGGFLPTRLLDLCPEGETCNLGSALRLCASSSLSLETSKYVALSYCWGRKSFLRTTEQNLASNMSSILIDSLPLTIQDAIYVTRRLGFRYLWVDALCIVQPSEGKASLDWLQECPKMGEIYGNASLTIIVGTQDAHDGFLKKQRLQPVRAHVRLENEVSLGPELFECQYVPPEPVRSRGWVFQEELLSKRILFFGKEEISWRCDSHRQFEHETRPRGSDRLLRESAYQVEETPSRVKSGSMNIWGELVERYSLRQFTVPSDKVQAIKGLQMQFNSASNSRYAYGINEKTAIRELLWRTFPQTKENTRMRTWRAPSWSWLASDREISCSGWTFGLGWRKIGHLMRFPQAESGSTDSHIDIMGYIKPISMLRLKPVHKYDTPYLYAGVPGWETPQYHLTVYLDDVSSIPPHDRDMQNARLLKCFFLFLYDSSYNASYPLSGYCWGVVLRLIKKDSISKFQRIGMFKDYSVHLPTAEKTTKSCESC